MAAACAGEAAVLAFKYTDDWIPVSNVSSPLILSLRMYRPYESLTVLTAHANVGLFLSPERQGKTIRFLHEIGSLFDPAYAEVAFAAANDGLTAMDYARNVFGDPQYPMETLYGSARTVLRGYGWVTVVPKELVSMVTDLDAFFKADLLPSGALWLQATQQFADYDHAAAQSVSAALQPVLPDVPIDRGLAERVRIAIE